MKHLHDAARVTEIKERLARLRPDTPRQWGKMTAPQMVAHLSVAFESALGDRVIPRVFIGRLIGGLAKRFVLGNDDALSKNSPTAPDFIISDERDLERERAKLLPLIDRFAAGPSACTTNPHAFFGRITPEEWAVLMYKHTDHHLRQFGV